MNCVLYCCIIIWVLQLLQMGAVVLFEIGAIQLFEIRVIELCVMGTV